MISEGLGIAHFVCFIYHYSAPLYFTQYSKSYWCWIWKTNLLHCFINWSLCYLQYWKWHKNNVIILNLFSILNNCFAASKQANLEYINQILNIATFALVHFLDSLIQLQITDTVLVTRVVPPLAAIINSSWTRIDINSAFFDSTNFRPIIVRLSSDNRPFIVRWSSDYRRLIILIFVW